MSRRRFRSHKNTPNKRNAYLALRRVLSGVTPKSGPYATPHGWPYFEIPAPLRTLSIRPLKSDHPDGWSFLLYETFRQPGRPRQCHLLHGIAEARQAIHDARLSLGREPRGDES